MEKKKFLSVILSGALLLSSGLTAVAEDETLNLTDLYASRKNVYLTFDKAPEETTAVTLTDVNGKNVPYTAKVQEGNVLHLELGEENALEIGKFYTVKSGDEQKSFKIKTIKAEDFSDGDYTDTFDYYKVGASAATQSPVGIYNGKLFMQQRYLSYFTIKDGLVDKLKNYSVEFDFEAYKEHCVGIIINKTEKGQQFQYGTKTEGKDELGWVWGNGQNWYRYLYRYQRTDSNNKSPIDGETFYENAVKVGGAEAKYRLYPSSNTVTYNNGQIGLSGNETDKTLNYAIDKMGKTGVLKLRNLVENTVVTDINTSDNAAETGHFFIGSIWSGNNNGSPDGRGFSIDNILVTTCDVISKIPELTDVYASTKSIYLTFDSDVFDDLSVEVKDKNDQTVAVTAKVCDKKMLRLTPTTSLKCDEMYTVIAGNKKFAFTIKQELIEDFSDGEYTDTLKFVDRSKAKAQIVDGKLYMLQGGLGHFLIKEGKVDSLKNYSVEFDMATYQTHREAIVFNKVNHGLYDGFHFSGDNDAYHGWVFESKTNTTANDLYRTYLLSDTNKTTWYGDAPISGTTVKPSTQKLTWNDDKSKMGFEETATEEYKKVAPTEINYAVDKMGKTGVLSMNGVFKDAYTHEASNETGYFYIGSAYTGNADGSGFSLDNIRVTTCTSKEILPEPNLTQLYASTKNVYLTFDGEPTTDINVKFTDLEGGAVSFTKAVQEGKVLRLTMDNALKIGTLYEIEVGTVKKIFRVVEVLNEDFSDGDYIDNLTFDSYFGSAKAGVLNGKLYMQQGKLGYFEIANGKVNTLKNYTVEFDMETFGTHREAIMFNKTMPAGNGSQFYYGDKVEGKDELGWTYVYDVSKCGNDIYRYYRTDDTTDTTKDIYTYSKLSKGTTPTQGEITYDENNGIGLNIGADATRNETNYTVDKMGRTGVLSLAGEIKDIYIGGAKTQETGYFYIGSAYTGGSDKTGFSLDNLVVTTCEELASKALIEEATATDANGNPIESVTGNDTVKGVVKVANLYSEEKPVIIVVAAFNGDTIINSTIAVPKNNANTVAAGAILSADYTLNGVSTADTLKVFCWDNLQNMTPVTTLYEIQCSAN